MLSVAQSAEMLGVSVVRVRQLIAQGVLPAQKVGRSWVLTEEAVYNRLTQKVPAGRPSKVPVIEPAGFPDVGSLDESSLNAGSPVAGSPDAGSPKAGFPKAGSPDAGFPDAGFSNACGAGREDYLTFHAFYKECRKSFARRPTAQELSQLPSSEEVAFRVALSDFFLQQKQREMVEAGVF